MPKTRGSPSRFKATRSANGSGVGGKRGQRFRAGRRRYLRRQPRFAFCGVGRTLGPARFPRARDRFFRQERADRQIRRDEPDEFPAHAGDFVLLVHRCVPACSAADARRRQLADPDLCRRRAGHAALQRHGGGEGGARSQRALSRRRSRRRQHPVNAISAARKDALPPPGSAFPLYPEMEPAELAIAAQRHDPGCRRRRGFICWRFGAGVWRGPPCRFGYPSSA